MPTKNEIRVALRREGVSRVSADVYRYLADCNPQSMKSKIKKAHRNAQLAQRITLRVEDFSPKSKQSPKVKLMLLK